MLKYIDINLNFHFMLLLNTNSLKGYGLNRIFEFCKKAEYDGIDLHIDFNQFDTYNEDYLKKLSKEKEVEIHTISAPKDISISNIRKLVELTKKLNAKILILQAPRYLDQKLTSWMKKEIPKLREKENISIALENAPNNKWLLGLLPSHSLANTQDLKKFKHVSLDLSRLGEKKEDLIRNYAIFRKFLVNIHVSNIKHGKKYAPPQDGILALESFLTKIRQDDFAGMLSLKVNPKFLKVGDDEELIENLKKSKKFIDKYFSDVEVLREEEENEEE